MSCRDTHSWIPRFIDFKSSIGMRGEVSEMEAALEVDKELLEMKEKEGCVWGCEKKELSGGDDV